jgi:hypothetical protein
VVNVNRFHGYLALQSRGVLALPPDVRRRWRLDQPGAQVEVTEREDGVIELRPHLAVPVRQDWFWSEEWQGREREADADIAAGRFTVHADADSFIDALNE